MSRTNYLFNDYEWFSVRDHQKQQLKQAIADLGANVILNTPLEDICEDLKSRFWIDVPVLDKEGAHASQREIEIDVSHDPNRYFVRQGPFYVKATEVSLIVPFSGDKTLFKVRPTQFTLSPPDAEVHENKLSLKVVGEMLEPQSVKTKLNTRLSEIETYLATLQRDVLSFNNEIISATRPLLEARRSKLLADRDLVSQLGFPLRARADQPSTFAAPTIRKKLKPSSLAQSNVSGFKPEPALLADDYDHILKVLDGMAMVMERSPSAFRNLDEEALRTHFLVQLNGHYEGQATGETFNYEGKTDILVRVEGRNIFIAECKYWGGPKKLLETIDQILGYSSWRDTKVAIIIFNRNKNFSAVLEAVRETVPQHLNFKRSLKIDGESRMRAVLAHKDDPSREMVVTLLAFDVPSESTKSGGYV